MSTMATILTVLAVAVFILALIMVLSVVFEPKRVGSNRYEHSEVTIMPRPPAGFSRRWDVFVLPDGSVTSGTWSQFGNEDDGSGPTGGPEWLSAPVGTVTGETTHELAWSARAWLSSLSHGTYVLEVYGPTEKRIPWMATTAKVMAIKVATS